MNKALIDETKSDTDLKKLYSEYLDLNEKILESHYQECH